MDFCGEYNEKEKNGREIAAVPRIGLTGRRHSVEYVLMSGSSKETAIAGHRRKTWIY